MNTRILVMRCMRLEKHFHAARTLRAYWSNLTIIHATCRIRQDTTHTPAEVEALFEQDDKPMQLAALSQQEMKETEGALLPLLYILGSAAISAWTYHAINYYRTGSLGSSSGAAWAALSGGLGAAVPMIRILGPYPKVGGFGIAVTRPFASNPYGRPNQFIRIDFHRNSHDPYIHIHRGDWGW